MNRYLKFGILAAGLVLLAVALVAFRPVDLLVTPDCRSSSIGSIEVETLNVPPCWLIDVD